MMAAGDANLYLYRDAYAWIQTVVPSCCAQLVFGMSQLLCIVDFGIVTIIQ